MVVDPGSRSLEQDHSVWCQCALSTGDARMRHGMWDVETKGVWAKIFRTSDGYMKALG